MKPLQLGDKVWKKDKVTARLDRRSCQVQTPDQERYRRNGSKEDQRSPNIHVDVHDITAFKNSEHASQSKPPQEAMQHHENVNINISTPAADTTKIHTRPQHTRQPASYLKDNGQRYSVMPFYQKTRCRADFIHLYLFYVFVTVCVLGNLRIVFKDILII